MLENPNALIEFMEYSEGAVASKEVIKKETGNVTLFAFDESQQTVFFAFESSMVLDRSIEERVMSVTASRVLPLSIIR